MYAALACALFGAMLPCASAANEAQARAARYATMEADLQQRLRSTAAQKAFRAYNATHAQQIQQSLAIVYARDPDYKAEAAAPTRLLSDSIVGPVTLKWLTRFCRDYGIVASDPDFEQEVVAALEHVAIIAKEHPDWMEILDSPDFNDWIAAQPARQRERSRSTRRSGAAVQVNALIDQYLRDRQPAPAPARAGEPIAWTYSYDPKRVAGIDDVEQIARRLRPMADWPAEGEREFDADLRDALLDLKPREETVEAIKRLSKADAYQLSPGGLKQLAQVNRIAMPEPAIIDLEGRMGSAEYENRAAFVQAFDDATSSSDFQTVFAKNKAEIIRGARQDRYKVPATLAADLAADAKLEPAVAAVFANFANVEYPTRELFERALEWQVRRSLHMCPDPPPHVNDDGKLPDEQFKALRPVLNDTLYEGVLSLRGVTNGCTPDQLAEADRLLYSANRKLIAPLALRQDFQVRQAALHSAVRQDPWAVPGCSCGRNKTDGMVVGFYPLWTDGAAKRVNFSALTRLALYGLTADDNGTLLAPDGTAFTGIPQPVAQLMHEAHRYDVGVDWVVAKSEWSAWRRFSDQKKRGMLNAMKSSIVNLLTLQQTGSARQTLIHLGSLGRDHGPTDGLGIALYFRHFPAADKALYNDFVKALADAIAGPGKSPRLSLIVDFDDLNDRNGPFDYVNLRNVINAVNPIEEHDNETIAHLRMSMEKDLSVLVMLPEPTSVNKKALRGAIQVALHGLDSMRLLRAIVPVLEYDGVGADQLRDDIVYASDNYYGIGFWPLPFASADAGKPAAQAYVNKELVGAFQPNGATTVDTDSFHDRVCPYRLWLRWLFWISALLAIGIGLYYFSCRGCNERVDSSALYFAGMMAVFALPLVTLMVLTYSDPLIEPHRDGVLVLYGVGGLVVALLVARHYFDKARRKVP
jgi:hypothetical protein